MTTSAQPEYHKMPRELRGAPLDAVRRLALRDRQDREAKDANEWYWVLRFNHTLYRTVHWSVFLGSEWRYPADLTRDEIEKLSRDDLAVLALSESAAGRRVAAQNAATPPSSLAMLARDREQAVYRAAGHNSSTPAEAIADMRNRNRADDVSSHRLRFLWAELPTYERIDQKSAIDVARGYHGDELRVALARRGYDDGGALTELAGSYSLPAEAASLLVDHPSDSVRAALARNEAPSVTASMLDSLSDDRSRDIQLAVIENPNTPEAALKRMIKDWKLRSAVIARGNLSTQLLIELEKDDSTRRDVIDRLDNNPMGWGRSQYGTPPDDFVELLRTWAHSPNQHTRIAVSRNAATPLEVLEELCGDETLAEHVASGFGTILANNHWSDGYQLGKVGWYKRYLSDTDLAFMAASPSPILRGARAGRHGDNPTVLDQLAQDSEPSVRAAVARSEWVGFPQLVVLADDDDESVQSAAAQSIRDLLRKDQEPDEEWSGEWLRDQTNFAAYFPTGHDGRVDMSLMRRVFLAGEPSWMCSSAKLDRLAHSKSAVVRAAVAAFQDSYEPRGILSYSLSADTMFGLLSDPDETVRIAAYGNAGSSAVAVARREDIPEQAVLEYARSSSDAVRSAIASNSAAPAPVLANLARDRSAEVRVAVAMNRATPPAALVALTRDDDEDVLLGLLSNPNTPTRFVEEQADRTGDYGEWERHRRIAANSSSPTDVLRRLAYSKRADVRQLIAQHPAVPADTLEILAFDEVAQVRDAASRPDDSANGRTE
ncbi:hypothetical protein [Microbacterium sp. NPDC056569]|uniref:hypothetical protein n=1 Tax=Microbacterium sp. NPDC056569 TaxID=3345867 RepID=UPI0036726353